MIDLKRILFATDFSECAVLAREMARQLAEQFGAELHILHVIHDLGVEVPDFGMGLAFPGYLENIGTQQREMKEGASKLLSQERSDCGSVNVVTEVRFGKPFVEIIKYARDTEMDLIVVGSHGRSGITHLLIGSVAERVVRKAPCPVLTVRPPARDQYEEETESIQLGIHPLPVG